MTSGHQSGTAVRGTVPPSYVRLLFDYLRGRAIEPERLLCATEPAAEDRRGYPVARWAELLARASEQLEDPHLGLHLGQTVAPHHLGVIGYVLFACGTMAGALERLQRYHRLIYDVSPMRIRDEPGVVELSWGVEAGRPGPLVDECAIAALIQFSRDITGRPDLCPESVTFVNPQPSSPAAYEAWFGCPVRFEQPATSVRLDAGLVALPLRGADPAMVEVLERQVASLPAPDGEPPTVLERARQALARRLHEGEPRLDDVAADLCISGRTLHRRLARHGWSFRALLADTRRGAAERYLGDRGLALSEIALLLGYSEQSAFTRAFRQWSGRTPKEFRRALESVD